jgi:hypothetical protein
MTVRVILVRMTLPVRIRPRIETSPVKGLRSPSDRDRTTTQYGPLLVYRGLSTSEGEIISRPTNPSSADGFSGCLRHALSPAMTLRRAVSHLEAQSDVLVPSALPGPLGDALAVLEDGLLLERLLVLHLELGHGVWLVAANSNLMPDQPRVPVVPKVPKGSAETPGTASRPSLRLTSYSASTTMATPCKSKPKISARLTPAETSPQLPPTARASSSKRPNAA